MSNCRASENAGRGRPNLNANLSGGNVVGCFNKLPELPVRNRSEVNEKGVDRDTMDGRLLRIMFVRSHAKGTARNRDHSRVGLSIIRLSANGIAIDLDHIHNAILPRQWPNLRGLP
jgi:hypothetical protein